MAESRFTTRLASSFRSLISLWERSESGSSDSIEKSGRTVSGIFFAISKKGEGLESEFAYPCDAEAKPRCPQHLTRAEFDREFPTHLASDSKDSD